MHVAMPLALRGWRGYCCCCVPCTMHYALCTPTHVRLYTHVLLLLLCIVMAHGAGRHFLVFTPIHVRLHMHSLLFAAVHRDGAPVLAILHLPRPTPDTTVPRPR